MSKLLLLYLYRFVEKNEVEDMCDYSLVIFMLTEFSLQTEPRQPDDFMADDKAAI